MLTVKSKLLGTYSALAYGTVISLLNPLKFMNAMSFDEQSFNISFIALVSFSDIV